MSEEHNSPSPDEQAAYEARLRRRLVPKGSDSIACSERPNDFPISHIKQINAAIRHRPSHVSSHGALRYA